MRISVIKFIFIQFSFKFYKEILTEIYCKKIRKLQILVSDREFNEILKKKC